MTADQYKKLRPSHWVCGGGSDINCEHWDDINGCWLGFDDFITCPVEHEFEDEELEQEYADVW